MSRSRTRARGRRSLRRAASPVRDANRCAAASPGLPRAGTRSRAAVRAGCRRSDEVGARWVQRATASAVPCRSPPAGGAARPSAGARRASRVVLPRAPTKALEASGTMENHAGQEARQRNRRRSRPARTPTPRRTGRRRLRRAAPGRPPAIACRVSSAHAPARRWCITRHGPPRSGPGSPCRRGRAGS